MNTLPVLAITGGTGFVGGTLVRHAEMRGHQVRALTRNPRASTERVSWISGALDRPDALARLVEGADAVIHVAGAINAPDRAGFDAANVTGTANMVAVAVAAGVSRFIHVSSLAAREPDLSDYGGSKARSEEVVAASGLDWTVVRPPAVYGPGDRETLELFRIARRGLMLVPPAGRLSVIEVSDLSRFLLTLAGANADETFGETYEPDDGCEDGWTHRRFAEAIGASVGRSRVFTVATPRPLMRLGARLDRLFRGRRAKLTLDRAAYFGHPDWVAALRPPIDLWRSHIETHAGLKATAVAYRAAGWL